MHHPPKSSIRVKIIQKSKVKLHKTVNVHPFKTQVVVIYVVTESQKDQKIKRDY